MSSKTNPYTKKTDSNQNWKNNQLWNTEINQSLKYQQKEAGQNLHKLTGFNWFRQKRLLGDQRCWRTIFTKAPQLLNIKMRSNNSQVLILQSSMLSISPSKVSLRCSIRPFSAQLLIYLITSRLDTITIIKCLPAQSRIIMSQLETNRASKVV